MTKRHGCLSIAFSIVALLGLAPASSAQNVSVQSASVSSVELVPGGDPVRLTLSGSGLNQVTAITVVNRRRPVSDVTVRLGRRSSTRLTAAIVAGDTAPVGEGFTLRLTVGRRNINVPGRTLAISVTAAVALPDLTVVAVQSRPCGGVGSATADTPVCVRLIYETNDQPVVDTPFQLRCSMNGRRLTAAGADLDANQFRSAEFDFGVVQAGNYPVSCTVDHRNTVAEASEANNAADSTITVERGAVRDLGITEIGTEWETQYWGRAQLDVTMANAGTTSISGLLSCTLGGVDMEIDGVAYLLEPGESLTHTASYELPDIWRDFPEGQSVMVTCSVEPPPGLIDSNEANDTASVSLQVPLMPRPDLTISITGRACGENRAPTDDTPLCVRASGAPGDGWALVPFVVSCTVDGQTQSREFDELERYDLATSNFDFGLRKAGRYQASCTIDEGNAVSETNEGNNTENATIVVERSRRRD